MSLSTRTALSFWNAAVRDFPKNTIDALYANEAWDLIDRCVKIIHQETIPVYKNRYMTEGVLTEVSDEIDLSTLPMLYGGYEEMLKLETTIYNVSRLLTSQTANKQGPVTTTLAIGTNHISLPVAMPDTDWIFDMLYVVNGSNVEQSYTISARDTNYFDLDVSETGTATWIVARTGAVTTEVLATVGSELQDIVISKRYSVVAGSNVLAWEPELVDGYTVNPPIITSGSLSYEITSYHSTYIVVDCTDTGELDVEVNGQAVVNGVALSSIVELRGIKTLVAGNQTLTFADETGVTSVSDYIFATLFNFNSGGSISYSIDNVTSTGFSINSDEATTLMWRIKQQGVTLFGADDSGLKKRIGFKKEHAEFNTWNTDAKQNQYMIIFYMTGDDAGEMKLQIKKGYGLSSWQSFIVRYVRLANTVSSATSTIDLLEGLQMELGILLLRWLVAKRSTEHPELLKLVENVPNEMESVLRKIYQTANIVYDGNAQKVLKKAA